MLEVTLRRGFDHECRRLGDRRREYLVGRAMYAADVLAEDPVGFVHEMVDDVGRINGITVLCRLWTAGTDWPVGLRIEDEPRELQRDRRFGPDRLKRAGGSRDHLRPWPHSRLRSEGRTLQQIASQLGFSDRSSARRAISRALAAAVREPAEELVILECLRLDALTRAAWEVLEAEHHVVSAGRLVHGPDGAPLRDDGPMLCAIDRLIRISERRCRLLGLDAPPRSRVQAIDEPTVDRAIRELEAELADRSPVPPPSGE
jgi:hypothetical protein